MPNRRTSIADALQERLATENRRVLSEWRAVLLLRRASREIPLGDRRWKTPPRDVVEIRPILNRLSKAGELVPLGGFPFLYRVNAPYARTEAVEEEEVLMELHPYAALSHISALSFHQMTDQLSKDIHVSIPDNGSGGFLPLGTRSEDWEGVALVRGRVSKTISAPYVLRAYPGAPVATPLEWSEVKHGLLPGRFHIGNARERSAERGDLFAGVLGKPQRIEEAVARLEKLFR